MVTQRQHAVGVYDAGGYDRSFCVLRGGVLVTGGTTSVSGGTGNHIQCVQCVEFESNAESII